MKKIKTGRLYRSCEFDAASIDKEKRTVSLSFSSMAAIDRPWGKEVLGHDLANVRLDRLNDGAPLLAEHDTNRQIGVVESAEIVTGVKGLASVRFGKNALADEIFNDVCDGIRRNVSVGYRIHEMEPAGKEDGFPIFRVLDWEPLEISIVSVPADNSVGIGRAGEEETEIKITERGIDMGEKEKRMYDIAAGTCASLGGAECCCAKCPMSYGCLAMPAGGGGCSAMGCEMCACAGCPRVADSVKGIGSKKEEGKAADSDKDAAPKKGKEEGKEDIDMDKQEIERSIATGKIEALKAERDRVREINAIAEKHPQLKDEARQFIESGKTLEEFRSVALGKLSNAIPISAGDGTIGMDLAEVKRYSIVRALRSVMEGKPLDGLEREASDAVAKLSRRAPNGFFVPHDVAKRSMVTRDMGVSDATKGGYAVDTEVLGSSMIELLRNKALVATLGARTISGLVGNIHIPKHSGGATAYWLPESGTVTKSDQALGQLGLTPKRLSADTAYSKELLMQGSFDVEAFIREDLMAVLAIEKDRAAINGLGAAGEPKGIINTTGVNTVTFGAAATWAKIIDFETQLASNNADLGKMAYLTSPAVRGTWKGIAKVSSYPVFLWETGANGSGLVNGYRAEATKQVPSDKVIFGNWDDLIFAEWAGIDVVVDPYSLKKSGQVEVTITLWCDMGVRRAVSFTVSTDSGAQ